MKLCLTPEVTDLLRGAVTRMDVVVNQRMLVRQSDEVLFDPGG